MNESSEFNLYKTGTLLIIGSPMMCVFSGWLTLISFVVGMAIVLGIAIKQPVGSGSKCQQ